MVRLRMGMAQDWVVARQWTIDRTSLSMEPCSGSRFDCIIDAYSYSLCTMAIRPTDIAPIAPLTQWYERVQHLIGCTRNCYLRAVCSPDVK